MRDVHPLPVDARPASDPLSAPDDTVADCTAFVESFVETAPADSLVLDLDGSPGAAFLAIVAAEALGPDRVQALSMTTDTRSDDAIEASATLATDLGISLKEIDLQPVLEEFTSRMATPVRERRGDFRAPLRAVEARLRMTIAYFEANTTGALVAGPVNRTDWLLGTGPPDGPMGADFLPIAHLYRTEVLALGLHAGVPRSVLVGGPTTGPVSRRVPEFLSGVPETTIDNALQTLVDEDRPVADAATETSLDDEVVARLAATVAASAHEHTRPPRPSTPGRP